MTTLMLLLTPRKVMKLLAISSPQSAYLDGGDGNDNLNIRGNLHLDYGHTTATAIGGLGNDAISLTDNNSQLKAATQL